MPGKKKLTLEVNSHSGCFSVTSHRIGGSGYPELHNEGKLVGAHRYIYELNFGKIPKGKLVMHSCDNKNCVNPQHLSVGSHKDNTRDMHRKSRGCYLEQHSKSKLTNKQVTTIRSLLRGGMFQKEIAKRFGVCQQTISAIKRDETWRRL